jgi:hypothetical protein
VTGQPVRALLLAGGTPPYVDPWHPFGPTADRLLEVVEPLGWTVERSDDVAGRLAAGLDDVDVLLVNAPVGDPAPDAAVLADADAALEAFLRRRVGVFALHAAAVTLLGLPRWAALTGATWTADVSGHPPLGPCEVDGHDGVPERFGLIDERYTDLALTGDRSVLVSYEAEEHGTQPLVWTREVGDVAVAVDTFGHDPRSFDAPEHVDLVLRLLRGLVER